MLKPLLKKQLLEVNAWLLQDKKKGKRRSGAGIAGMAVLYIFIFGILIGMFAALALSICSPLYELGLGWLYFTIMATISVMLGVFGGVFNTYATMYKAKDNEFLLAMPIKPSYVLISRLFGVFFWSSIYGALVFIPAMVVYWIRCSVSVQIVICDIVVMLMLSIFVLSLSCILGYVVARVSNKLKNRSYITVIISVLFIALYYYFYFKANSMIQSLLANAESIGRKMEGAGNPLYWAGEAGAGSVFYMLILSAAVLVLWLIVYLVLSVSFLKMATFRGTEEKKKYSETMIKAEGLQKTLLKRERIRFTSSANYMLNCGLGTLFIVIGAVFMIIKADWLRSFTVGIDNGIVGLVACGILCMASSMNDITAPSISLEGKSLWVIQSLPVSAWEVIKAKLKLHLIITEIPMIFCSACAVFVLKPDVYSAVMMIVIPVLFVVLTAAFGLMIGLLMPNLSWTDEIVPIKQSMGVMIALFGGWIFAAVLALVFYLLTITLSIGIKPFMAVCVLIITAADAALILWLRKAGSEKFSRL